MLFQKFTAFALIGLTAVAQAAVKGKAFDHDYALAHTDPSFQALFPSGILLDNYHGLAHPSQPNYIAAIGGSTNGFFSDSSNTLGTSYSSIVDLLEAKQLTWKTYQENIPSVCYTGTSSNSLYYRKHNPFISYSSISQNSVRCQNIVPATQLSTDLMNGALPNYAFYTPNIKNDGHDTTVAYAGQWLTNFINPLLQNTQFNNNTLVVVTFDEAENYFDTTNHVVGLLLGDVVKGYKNTVDSTFYTHYSLLSTVESNWGLGNLGKNDVNKELSNVFSFVAALTGYQNVAVPNPPLLNL
ncbi:hypothetical protein BGZ49_000893 [Haplosporangium sp. Z 27]|nr:hypothetical protein BGZ49_000893 [Haplosporangium sp. Z 27]